MAKFEIVTTDAERNAIIAQIKKYEGEQVSVAKLCKGSTVNVNRARWVLEDLLSEGRIEKVVVKEIGDNYKRYSYRVIGG